MNRSKTSILLCLTLVSCALAGCWPRARMNFVEFEPDLDRACRALEVYGVGFEGYEDPNLPNDFILIGSVQGASTGSGDFRKFVYIGEPKIVIESEDGERHTLPLRWMSEEPPAKFSGRITIRIYNLEEGLIHWNPDPLGYWDYPNPNNE